MTLVVVRTAGQVSITSRSFGYTNTFNTLASSGTPAWSDNVTQPGWYAARVNAGTNAPFSTYTPNTGTSVTGALYSYGSTLSTERALGSVADFIGNTAYGVRLRNNSGVTLTSFTLTYTGEQWRRAAAGGGAANHTLVVAYRVSASTITSADPANTATWTVITNSTFDSPIDSRTGSGAALDGNNAANRVANIYSGIVPISLPNNSELFIRWFDLNDSNSDHGLAIDDVRIFVPEVPVAGPLAALAAAALAGALRRRRRAFSGS